MTLLVGKKGSGKSHLCCEWLLTHWKGVYDEIIFISPTFRAQYDKLWKKLAPDGITVYEEVNEELFKSILKKVEAREGDVLLVLDDLGAELRQLKEKTLNTLVSNSRHYRLSIVALHQRLTQAPTSIRANADSIVMFSANSYVEMDYLWKMVSTVEKKRFNKMFRSATVEPYSFMVSLVTKTGNLKFYQHDLVTEIKLDIEE